MDIVRLGSCPACQAKDKRHVTIRMMSEKRVEMAIPLILLVFAAVFATMAKHSAYKVTGGYFNLKANVYIPIVFLIASIWAIVLTIRGSLSPILKLLSIGMIALAIALLAFPLSKELHRAAFGR